MAHTLYQAPAPNRTERCREATFGSGGTGAGTVIHMASEEHHANTLNRQVKDAQGRLHTVAAGSSRNLCLVRACTGAPFPGAS